MFQPLTQDILHTSILLPPPDRESRSREGRPIPAYQFGTGPIRISLIAGCHADEPTGPRLLRKLVCFMEGLSAEHPMLRHFQWWIVPHVNPDGEAANQRWHHETDERYDLARYLRYAVRELPGDDVEYGFPIAGKAEALRPENQFVYDFWRLAGGPFHLHVSLHSMGMAFGAWYLLERSWADRAAPLVETVRRATKAMGYPLHDVDRGGEKGFHRLTKGFSTRPDSESMKQYFLERNDPGMAARFRPSSMESIRSLDGDCLTLVTEMPMFVIPREHPDDLSWPNPDWEDWRAQFGIWKIQLERGTKSEEEVRKQAEEKGLRPMPVADQMRLQWVYLCAGLELVYPDR